MIRVLACVLACTLGSCVSLTREPPDTVRYSLTATRAAEPTASPSATAIEVRTLHAVPPYTNRKLVYRNADDSIDIDFYSEFIVAPSAAVTHGVRTWLAESRAFRTAHAGRSIAPDWVIEGEVHEAGADLRDGTFANLAVHILVIARDGARVLHETTYRERVAIPSAAPRDVVAGLSQALARVCTALERQLLEIAD